MNEIPEPFDLAEEARHIRGEIEVLIEMLERQEFWVAKRMVKVVKGRLEWIDGYL